MKANISDDELKLLAFLHENARGYTSDFPFDPDNVCSVLKIEGPQLAKDGSYLASHGLIGIDIVTDRDGIESVSQLWLAGQGEDYMRELENQPGVPRKVTVKVVIEMGK